MGYLGDPRLKLRELLGQEHDDRAELELKEQYRALDQRKDVLAHRRNSQGRMNEGLTFIDRLKKDNEDIRAKQEGSAQAASIPSPKIEPGQARGSSDARTSVIDGAGILGTALNAVSPRSRSVTRTNASGLASQADVRPRDQQIPGDQNRLAAGAGVFQRGQGPNAAAPRKAFDTVTETGPMNFGGGRAGVLANVVGFAFGAQRTVSKTVERDLSMTDSEIAQMEHVERSDAAKSMHDLYTTVSPRSLPNAIKIQHDIMKGKPVDPKDLIGMGTLAGDEHELKMEVLELEKIYKEGSLFIQQQKVNHSFASLSQEMNMFTRSIEKGEFEFKIDSDRLGSDTESIIASREAANIRGVRAGDQVDAEQKEVNRRNLALEEAANKGIRLSALDTVSLIKSRLAASMDASRRTGELIRSGKSGDTRADRKQRQDEMFEGEYLNIQLERLALETNRNVSDISTAEVTRYVLMTENRINAEKFYHDRGMDVGAAARSERQVSVEERDSEARIKDAIGSLKARNRETDVGERSADFDRKQAWRIAKWERDYRKDDLEFREKVSDRDYEHRVKAFDAAGKHIDREWNSLSASDKAELDVAAARIGLEGQRLHAVNRRLDHEIAIDIQAQISADMSDMRSFSIKDRHQTLLEKQFSDATWNNTVNMLFRIKESQPNVEINLSTVMGVPQTWREKDNPGKFNDDVMKFAESGYGGGGWDSISPAAVMTLGMRMAIGGDIMTWRNLGGRVMKDVKPGSIPLDQFLPEMAIALGEVKTTPILRNTIMRKLQEDGLGVMVLHGETWQFEPVAQGEQLSSWSRRVFDTYNRYSGTSVWNDYIAARKLSPTDEYSSSRNQVNHLSPEQRQGVPQARPQAGPQQARPQAGPQGGEFQDPPNPAGYSEFPEMKFLVEQMLGIRG